MTVIKDIAERDLVPENAIVAAEFMAFKIGQEEYGIDILKVQELRGYELVTQIAGAPACLKGVVNLRGAIVPIIDMRILLGTLQPEYNQFTVVMILNIGKRTVGVVVDSVSDVISLTPAEIKPAPEMGSSVRSDYLLGLGAVGERMLILVDIEQLILDSGFGQAHAA